MQTPPRILRSRLPIWSIRTLLIIVACVAAFLSSYIHRQQRSDMVKDKLYIDQWDSTIASPTFTRITGDLKRLPNENFRYPIEVDFADPKRSKELFELLPICDSLKGISWRHQPLSEEEARLIYQRSRCQAIQFSQSQDCSAIFPYLRKMHHLQQLSFNQCTVTQNDIEILAAAKQLKILIFRASGMTRSQIQFLRDSMPSTYVICMDSKPD